MIVVLFTTHMFIGGFFGFILDNTIPGTAGAIPPRADVDKSIPSRAVTPLVASLSFSGTDKERGIKSWRDKVQVQSKNMGDQSCYDIPFCNGLLKRFRCFQYLPFLPSYKSAKQGTAK